MYLKNIKKLYQCILFNDVLVFAHGDSKQSKVELQLDLEAVWFEDLEDLDPQSSKNNAINIPVVSDNGKQASFLVIESAIKCPHVHTTNILFG